MHLSINKKKIYLYLFILIFLSTTLNINHSKRIRDIFKLKKIDIVVNPINTDQFPTIAKRPRYSVLDTSKIEEIFNVNIPDWKKSLRNEN